MKQPVTDVLQTKCSACGGMTEFSPADQQLKCVYCGAKTQLDLSPAEIKENDFYYWAEQSDENLLTETTEATEIKCRQCGAVTTLPPDKSSSNCAFCGTPLILHEAEVKRFWQPEYMLPFKIDRKQCSAIFDTWLGKRWFLPSRLKKEKIQTDRFKGVYMPFWTYDASTDTFYTGERGVHRRVYSKNQKGETIEKTVTDWYATQGSVHVDFDDVIVPASDSLPSHILDKLTNWDRMNCIPYKKECLAGFTTDIYRIDFKQGVHTAKRKMEEIIESTIKEDIGGDEQRVKTKSVSYNELMFKLLILPVWISAFRFEGKLYQFVINGRTGEVTGDYPKSVIKIILFVITLIAILAVIYMIMN